MDLILRNGKLVTPAGIIDGDLGVENGKIVATGKVSGSAAKEIDCTGKHILPGGIDIHVHFRDPGFPEKGDFGTESRAALAGGITTALDMPNTKPPTTTLKRLEEKRHIATEKSRCNFGLYMGLTDNNIDEIRKAKNIAGVKVYMGSTTGNLLVQDVSVIEKLLETGKLAVFHAESEKLMRENEKKYEKNKNKFVDPHFHSLIRSHEAAEEAVKTALHAAKKHDARIHITHISTIGELEEIKKFKSLKVSCDVTPVHLHFTTIYYEREGNFVKVNPPIREENDRQALWKYLKEGFIDCVTSDHAPHTREEKEKFYWEAPSGVPGVQTTLPLLLDATNHGEFSLQQVVKLISENPAKLFNIKNKGKLEVGYDADIVIVDMGLEQELTESMLFYKCGWSPYTGWKLKGWPIMTIIGGKVGFENGKIIDEIRGKEVVFE